MDKDLKKIIDETLDEYIKKDAGSGNMCPGCNMIMTENTEYTDDGGKTWRHSKCNKIIYLEESVDGMPPSGEEKYSKQEPGGDVMAAANTSTLANENMKKSEREESKPVAARGFERFANNMMNFVNASKIPLKVTVTEISVMADEIHSVKSYIVRVENE